MIIRCTQHTTVEHGGRIWHIGPALALVNYRKVADRFGHIDGELVGASLGIPESNPYLTVRFYPWWEHPQYLEARENNEPWAFADVEEGAREVTIHPRGLVAFAMSRYAEVTDCWFAQSGRYIWPYEPDGQIIVNQPVDLDALAAAVAETLDAPVSEVRRIVDVSPPYAEKPPFSLRLPRSVLVAAMEGLDDLGVGYHKSYVPDDEPLPVALVIDDDNWIVAEDFEVDFPDFEHRPEWFDASLYPGDEVPEDG